MKRMLGTIEVSPIGMGCMGFSHGYGEIPSHDYSVNAIRKAYEFGCTFLIRRKRMVRICFQRTVGTMRGAWGRLCMISGKL